MQKLSKLIKDRKADKLAREILMPKNEFIKKFNELKMLYRLKLKTPIIVNLVYYFKVPAEEIEKRIDELSLRIK